MNSEQEQPITYEERLNDSYRKAQVIMGITKVFKVQIATIGFKAWSKMKNDEKSTLLYALRRVWDRENKKDANV